MPEKLPTTANPAPGLDPRLYQIAMLASLLAYGMVRLDFEIAPGAPP